MANKLGVLFISLFVLTSANAQKRKQTVFPVKHDQHTEYHIKTHRIKDSLHIRLSDFAGDFEFVRLETTTEGLVSGGSAFYIDQDYILFEKFRGAIYQFARDGKFIRKLVGTGKGPFEFSDGEWTVDETNQILYLTDRAKKNYFLSFDLKSGKYIGNVPKAIPSTTTSIYALEDNVLLANTYMAAEPQKELAAAYWQDGKGKMINSIPGQPNEVMFFSYLTYAKHEDAFRIKMLGNDTVYSIQNQEMLPYLSFDFGHENPPNRYHMGFTTIRVVKEVESWVMLDVDIISEILKNKEGQVVSLSSKVQYYMLDKENPKAYHRGSIFIDPVHHQDKHHWIFYNPNGIFVKPYEAVDLLELAEEAFANPDFKDPYKSKLKTAIKDLSEDDNPILLIGTYK